MTASLSVYVVLELLGLAAFPLAAVALRWLPDRGWAMSKALGLLLVVWPVWLVGTLTPLEFSRPVVTLAALGLAGVSAFALWRSPALRTDLGAWLRARWGYVLAAEGVFALAFAGWALYRSGTPSIGAGESLMNLALFNSVVLGHHLPPLDPFFSGHTINYYYFGYVVFGGLTQLAGVFSSVGYNLSLVSVFALTVLGCFGLVFNLIALGRRPEAAVRPGPSRWWWVGAGGGAFLLALAGNLAAVGARLDGVPRSAFNWYGAAFVIHEKPPPITQFPVWGFLFGDLHPHLMATPIVLLSLTLALGLVARRLALGSAERLWGARPDGPALLALLALALGALSAINTWDLIPCGALAVLAVVLAAGPGGRARLGEWGRRVGPALALLAGLALLAFLPFQLGLTWFGGAPGLRYPGVVDVPVIGGLVRFVLERFALNDQPKTAGGFFEMFGLLLAPLLAFLAQVIVAERAWRARGLWRWVLLPSAAAILAAVLLAFPLLGVLVPLGLLAGWLAARTAPRGRPGHAVALVLLALGAGLALLSEVVYVRDFWGARVNTVFKVYWQVWLLWSLAAGYAVWSLGRVSLRAAMPRWRVPARVGWAAGVVLLVLAGSQFLVYWLTPNRSRAAPSGPRPALASATRTPARAPARAAKRPVAPIDPNARRLTLSRRTLDGLAWLARRHGDDLAAIRWLAAQPPDGGVAEAPGPSYGEWGRVAATTGQPTILAWNLHEYFWRSGSPAWRRELRARIAALERLWITSDPVEARRILERYHIRYVFVGTLEKRFVGRVLRWYLRGLDRAERRTRKAGRRRVLKALARQARQITTLRLTKWSSFMRPVFRSRPDTPNLTVGTTVWEMPPGS